MNFWSSRMDLFDQENGIGDMWEDFMSDPALVQDVLAPSKEYEWGNVLSHRERTTLGVVLRDRLMTDAALGGPRPIKSEHSYSMLAASPPASPTIPVGNQQITNSIISSIQNEINNQKQAEPKSIGLRTKIDDMEEECYPAIPMNTASANNLQNSITNRKHGFSQINVPDNFIIKGEPISEPNSPESSCLPIDSIEDKKNITMISPSQLHCNFKNFPQSTSESDEDDEEYYQNMDVECEIKDSGDFKNRKRSRQGLPPTPPSSASSDSEGTPSASCSPEHRNSQSTSHVQNLRGLLGPRLYVTNNGHSTRQPIHTSLISCQPKGSTGSLILTDEEKKTLVAEGYPVPTKMPLTKLEEKSLKKVRRKIKNKISAQESRRKKKEYMDGLERRVNLLAAENENYKNRVNSLEGANRNLHDELKRLQALVGQSS